MGVGFIALLWLGNLRGIRESATLFAVPTYIYLVAIFGLLAYRRLAGRSPAHCRHYTAPPGWTDGGRPQGLGLLLILRAFAAGSVALTGTEAVSNGVRPSRPPEARNAGMVLILMGELFGAIFLGISFLASQIGIVPDPTEQETVISQLTRTLVGAGTPFHYLIQLSTALLLVLAANTAFADFPRLASILGKDRFLPRQFQFRGDRLAFSFGIMVLAVLAAALVVAFGGSVTGLIPLYTVGVFMAFTLSQSGMVVPLVPIARRGARLALAGGAQRRRRHGHRGRGDHRRRGQVRAWRLDGAAPDPAPDRPDVGDPPSLPDASTPPWPSTRTDRRLPSASAARDRAGQPARPADPRRAGLRQLDLGRCHRRARRRRPRPIAGCGRLGRWGGPVRPRHPGVAVSLAAGPAAGLHRCDR